MYIDQTIEFVKQQLAHAEGGHDWWHIERVYNLAITLAKQEKVDITVVKLAALLHDVADSKFHKGDEEIGPRVAADFMEQIGVEKKIARHVVSIIENISYKGGKETQTFSSKELDVVQDADRLDAMGAIGIARTFNYGGFKNREIYNPNVPPNLAMTKEEYKHSTAPSINHFYEKLLLLKDRMNTATGRAMAEQRHLFMQQYLEQFYAEWCGEK
jgi:uncharacterized protein